MPDDTPSQTPAPLEWPITGTLDLHLFQPKEADDLVPVYLGECPKRGILQVRIIHGKGTGQLRERVHAFCGGYRAWLGSAWRRKDLAGGGRRWARLSFLGASPKEAGSGSGQLGFQGFGLRRGWKSA